MPLSDRPPTIEVPRVERCPEVSRRQTDVAAVSDYLLTMLLGHDAGLLHADFAATGGQWWVRGWTSQTSTPDEVVALTESKAWFRGVLARFGHHYMGGQLYGGFAEAHLNQNGIVHHLAVYMANDSWRGYWLKAYARRT